MDRPGDNYDKRKDEEKEIFSKYSNYTINELLDERNYLKSLGVSVENIDLELSLR